MRSFHGREELLSPYNKRLVRTEENDVPAAAVTKLLQHSGALFRYALVRVLFSIISVLKWDAGNGLTARSFTMKQWLVPLVLTLGVLLIGSMWLHGQGAAPAAKGTDKDKRTVCAAGTATIRVKPDAARLFLTVQTSAPTVKKARADNDAKFIKVRYALATLRIADLKMKTSDVNLEPEYSKATDTEPAKVIGYRVTNQFTVLATDSDVHKLGEHAAQILDTALEEGVNVVSRVAFFKQDDSAIRREAMTKAVEAAVVNAKALTAGIKAEVFDTVTISDTPMFHWGDRLTNSQSAFNGGGQETQFVAGDVEVTCRVSVSCTY